MADPSAGDDDPEDDRPREEGNGVDDTDPADAPSDADAPEQDDEEPTDSSADEDERPTDETPFDVGGEPDEGTEASDEDHPDHLPDDYSPPEEDDAATLDATDFGAPPEGGDASDPDPESDEAGPDAEDDYATDDEEFADSFGSAPESTYDDGEDGAPDAADAAAEGTAEPTVSEPVEAVGAAEGPQTDEELPLAAHIEEMVRRLAVVLGIAGLVTLFAYPASEFLIEFLWQSYIPDPDGNRPHIYGPLEFVLTKLKVAGLSGTVVGLPVFVYQSYRFMKPGLYPTERRYYLASVPTSLILAFVGVAFSHFVILPLTMLYFTSYTSSAAVVAFGLRETFNLIVLMMGYMAIVFQIPLFVMLAIMMGIVTREWMEDKRLLFWGGFGGLAFTFVTVDPTGMAPIIIAVTMIVLFEGTLLLLRWTGN